MIRPITLITALLFVLSGAYLFTVKYRSQLLDDQLTATTEATRLDAQRIRVLQAQWALEVDPSRLSQLSTQFMSTLQPMKPSQLVTLATLTAALPAPGSPVPGGNPEDAVPVMPVPAGPADGAVASAAPVAQTAKVATASRTATAPMVAATAATATVAAATATAAAQGGSELAMAAPSRAETHAARAAVRRPEQLASVESLLHHLPEGRRAEHARHVAANHEYAENRPTYRPYAPQSQMASALAPQTPMGAQVMSVRAVSTPAPAPMNDGGSLLGMAQGTGN
jgi:hypothetical protein